jgi:hypothetical protein
MATRVTRAAASSGTAPSTSTCLEQYSTEVTRSLVLVKVVVDVVPLPVGRVTSDTYSTSTVKTDHRCNREYMF